MIPVKIEGTFTSADGEVMEGTLVGQMSVAQDGDAHPEHPIVLPPDLPPTDAHPEHPIVLPPEVNPTPPDASKPPLWIPVWVPGYGWIAVPAFPHPAPSGSGKRR